jgi:transposase
MWSRSTPGLPVARRRLRQLLPPGLDRPAHHLRRAKTASYVVIIRWTGHGAGYVESVVPDGLWEIAKPLIPPSRVRPQGGGTQDTPHETLFAAIVYVLVSGCAWRQLPPCFGISKSTAHRRLPIWSRAGVWSHLHEAVLHRLDDAGLTDVTRVVLGTAHVRAKKGGRTHRPEPRGPGQVGFQDARPVGRERTAPPRRCLGRQHPRQRRAEAHDRRSPNDSQ